LAAVGGGNTKPSEEPCEEEGEAPAGPNNLAAVPALAGNAKPAASVDEPCEDDEDAPANASSLAAIPAGDDKPSEGSCEDEEAPAGASNLAAVPAGDAKPSTSPTESHENNKPDLAGTVSLVTAKVANAKSPTPVLAAESVDSDGIKDDDYEKDDEGEDDGAGETMDSTPVPLPSPIADNLPKATSSGTKNEGTANPKPKETVAKEDEKPSRGTINFEDVDAGDGDAKASTPDAKPATPVLAAEGGEKGDGKASTSTAGGGATDDKPTGMAGSKPHGTASGGERKPCDMEKKSRRSRLFRLL
jgi:hypothetical protein